MANIEQRATVDIDVNSKSAQHKLAELSNKLEDLNKKKLDFFKVGDLKGMERTDAEIKKVERSMNRVRTNAEKCEAAMKKLSAASPKELRLVLKQLQNDLEHIERGSDAWHKHVEVIKQVKAEIKAVDAEFKEHQSLISQLKGTIKSWGMSIASAVAAYSGLKMMANQAVEAYAEMEAEMANVRKYTGMAAEQVEHLNEAFMGMDTRTAREDLNKLAQEAGRLGLQTEEDVLGFVKAADVINVALDDLGEGATLTLSKLTDIFGDKQALGVEQSLLSVGSVINELSQNCTASAPYLANFAQRLAGVGKQAGMTIPQIMGFAAVLDSQGQAVEMSATALSQLIMKLFQDPAKIAKATGMELQKFNEVLKKDTNEALIMLLEQLNKLGDLSVLAPVFQSMGTDGARASQVIAALAGNVEQVKQQQLAANQAYQEGTSVTKEFNVQNNTVQAQLDKAKKGFKEVTIELGQKLAPVMKATINVTSAFMRVISMMITFISENRRVIIPLAAAIAAYTVVVKLNTMAKALNNAVTTEGTILNTAWMAISKTASTVWGVLTGKITLATAAQKAWNLAMKANPVGLVIAGITALVSAMIMLTRSTNDQAKAQETLNNIKKDAASRMVDEQQKIDTLMAAAKNMNLTYNQQEAAVKELNRIIPGFNGNINATTREFTYSQDALKKYNDELVRLYELEGAKEKLKELGKQKAELVTERNELEKEIKDEKERQRQQNANIAKNPTNYSTSSGGSAPSIVSTSISNSATLSGLEHRLNKINDKIKTVDTSMKALKETYGSDLQRQAVTPPPTTPGSNITGRPVSEKELKEQEKERKKREEEEKKRQAEEAKKARIAAALAKKEFKDALDMVQSNLSNQNAAALEAYNKGEIDYLTYLEKKHEASKEYYEAAKEVYKKFEAEESADAAKLREKEAEELKKYKEERLKAITEQLAEERDKKKTAANMDYYDPDNQAAYHNQRELNKKLAEIEIEYLRKVLKVQEEGSQGYENARRALAKAEREEELRQRKQMEEDMTAWLYIYSQQGAKARMAAELAVVDELLKQEIIKTEEAEEAKAAIRRKYRDEVNSKTGTKAPNQDFSDTKTTRDQQMAALEDAYKQGLISEEDYQSRRWQIIQNYHNKITELIKGESSTWATLITELVETWEAGFDTLGETIPEKLKTIGQMAAAAFAVMNEGITTYPTYANASRDLEVAKVTESYDKQIAAAGKNQKKAQNLEEKKNKEIAKIKTKYDKRAQAIEMAQAIASTALAAINAYASASKVSWILGPIAAAMATAAGYFQIAAIKKQHQVQQMGYYEGGFIRRDRDNRREVGVVHANEFVANHEAVANPNLSPVLSLIDRAQRSNTVGSLTADDVSRAIGQGRILGQTISAQQQISANTDAGMAVVAASVQEQADAITRLKEVIDDGIEAYVVMEGERGLDKQYKRYQRLINNPKR